MKTTILTALAVICAGYAHAAVIVTTEKYANTTPTDGNTWNKFTTIANLSNTDYANASQGHATFSVPTDTAAKGGGTAILNNGLGQANENSSPGSSFFDVNAPNRYLIDLGSAQSIFAFNSYSWHVDARQNQAYTLYGSTTLLSAGSGIASANLVSTGWNFVGSVTTSYSTATPGQVGVSFTDNLGGSIFTARYVLVDVLQAGGSSFIGEFDVVTVPEPSSVALLGFGLLAACLRGRRRRLP